MATGSEQAASQRRKQRGPAALARRIVMTGSLSRAAAAFGCLVASVWRTRRAASIRLTALERSEQALLPGCGSHASASSGACQGVDPQATAALGGAPSGRFQTCSSMFPTPIHPPSRRPRWRGRDRRADSEHTAFRSAYGGAGEAHVCLKAALQTTVILGSVLAYDMRCRPLPSHAIDVDAQERETGGRDAERRSLGRSHS